MFCPECGKKCETIKSRGCVWVYKCAEDGYFGYNGYTEPAQYECYGAVNPLDKDEELGQ